MAMKKISNSISNIAKTAGEKVSEVSGKAINGISKSVEKIDKEKINEVISNTSEAVQKVANNTVDVAKRGVERSSDAINKVMDVNGDGQVDIEDIIIMGLRIPGIAINREEFLRSEFVKDFPKEVIDDAITYNPAHAGIMAEQIEKYANEVIKFERNCVSGISAALSTPGGIAMAATIPADIAQYYGYMLRVTQKLLMKKALTKGTIYPIVKSTAKWFGVKMTKEVFTGFFKHAIPVVGGVIGGGLTYVSFKPCCDKLKISLQDTLLSNPEHISSEYEDIIIENEVIDNED